MKIEGLWAGTETSLKAYQDAEANMEARSVMTPEDDTVEKPYDLINGVAVVSIKGPLTNRDSWMNDFMGVTSYNTIRDGLIQAAEDPDVEQILLDVDSGGGSVSGVADTAHLIRMIHSNVKRVTAFTGGSMYSAAYWLASAAGSVYADKTAGVGSIGVIATHMSYAEALKKDGIEATVIRAGKYKALASSVEPLTDEARAQIQKQLDSVYKVFVTHVAEMRGKSYNYADEIMANGREFIGEASIDAGLVDGIKSFDEVMTSLKNSIDISNKFLDNRSNSQIGDKMKRRALSEAAIAAMAEGIQLDASSDPVDTPITETPVVEGDALTEAKVDAATADPSTTTTTPSADLINFLQAQIKEKDAALLAANIQIADLTKQNAEVAATHDGLLAIAKKSISNMRVFLGGSTVDLEGSSAVAVLAEHKDLTEKFLTKVKVGGVAAVDAAQPQVDAKPAQDAFAQRLQNAVRFSK